MLRPPLLRTRVLRPSLCLRSRPVSSLAPPLIRIQNGTFYQNYPTPDDAAKNQNPALFPDFSFELPSEPTSSNSEEKPQHWAIVGSAGRTKLLDILRGQYVCLPPAARSYPYLLTDEIAQKGPRLRHFGNAIQYVGFNGEGSSAIGGTRGAYLSARYESLREETDWTLRQYLKGQMSLNPLEGEEEGTLRDPQLLDQVVEDLRLGALLDMPVANLSNGQTRRARIAKALLSKPELLLLDDPFVGLDPATTRSISGLLQRLAAKSNPRLILGVRSQVSLPEWITHLMVLGISNQVLFQGTRAEAQRAFEIWHNVLHTTKPHDSLDDSAKRIYYEAKKAQEAGNFNRQLLWDLGITVPRFAPISLTNQGDGEVLIEMDGVRVQYGDKVVLGDWKQKVNKKKREGLHWKVRRGQRWAVLGANGSGKTTLLSLITSDHPQAYALPIKLFGRSRLPEPGKPAVSLFELQSRIGHSSPEIHAFFPRQLTLRQCVESAFAETFLSKPQLSHERDLDVSAVLRFFKADLDPDYDPMSYKVPYENAKAVRVLFPKLPGKIPKDMKYTANEYEVDYAESVTFGQLNMAQQRVVLFMRALVHRPDIVILDEAFAGMSNYLRDRCIHFLEVGEYGRNRSSTSTRQSFAKDYWLRGYETDDSTVRFNGLTNEQALIMVSHHREEIPDIVRCWMRLPSELDGEEESLDFRFGMVRHESAMRHPQVWDLAWLPPSEFKKTARRTWRWTRGESGERIYRDKGDDPSELRDEEVYEMYSI